MRALACLLAALVLQSACSDTPLESTPAPIVPSDPVPSEVVGCDGQVYSTVASSRYVLPFPVGSVVETGLTNCSQSFHSASQPDRYASDFDVPTGTPFTAARAGTVTVVVEDQPSNGGGSGAGNYLVVDHGDGTSALYYHSPEDGIEVEVGDAVAQGDRLGVVGRSGLAGYPHLHFIVVEGDPAYPYEAVPVSFRNAAPPDVALESNGAYEALPY